MVIVYSATKRLSAMALALLHSRDLLDYEERTVLGVDAPLMRIVSGVLASRPAP